MTTIAMKIRKSLQQSGTFILHLAAVLLFLQPVHGQLPTATILGVVRDPSGAVVPNASVTVTQTDTGLTRAAQSGSDGRFRFPALPVGAYEIRVEHVGFQAEERKGLTLAISDEAVMNFTLQVGGVEQTISITAEAPLVNTTSGAIGSLVTEQKVADLPLNGRNYIDLALMQPGIVQHKGMSNASSTVGTWFSSNGAPLRSNNYLLDGAILTNNTGATSASSDGSTLGIEGIREYKVITNSFSAEYGLTMGSQVVMVSKSGTNSIHGSVFEYLRNNVFDARNYFDYPTAATGPDFRLPPLKRNQFGVSVGGPIRRDRTFFHAVFEGLRERLGTTNIANVPHEGCHGAANGVITFAACPEVGAAIPAPVIAPQIAPLLALFPNPNLPDNVATARYSLKFTQPTTEDFVQFRVDHSFSNNSTFYARYSIDDTEQTNPLNYEIYQQVRDSRSQSGTVSENHVLSPALLNTVRFSYSRTNPAVLSSQDLVGPQYSYLPGTPMGSLAITGITGISPASKSLQRRNILSLSDDMFYSLGRHSLKFGALVNAMHTYSNVNTQALGSVSFTNMRNFLVGLANTYNANTPGSILDRTYRYETVGMYLQDDLQLRQNLTLNLGLRYEFMTVPSETRGHGSAVRDLLSNPATTPDTVQGATLGAPFKQMSLKNFSPRLGIAWDVMGDGKMSVRGGFAELYDIAVFGQSLSIAVTGTPPFSSVSNVTQPTTIALPLVFPTATAGRSLRTLDYNLEQPHILDYHLTVERQLPGNMAITVAYAGSRGLNILQTKDGNPTVRGGVWNGADCVPATGSQAASAGDNACWLGQGTAATAANPGALKDVRNSPYWDGLEFKTAGGNSWYNSLQFSLNKRLSSGFQFQSSYTYAKVIDETQGQAGADNGQSSIFGAEPSRRQTDRAVADFDATHNWRINSIYQLPRFYQGGGVLGMLANGWRLSNILSLQTGYPFSPALNTNRSRSVVNTGGGGIDRPDMAAGRTRDDIILGGTTRYYDPAAFSLQRVGFLGNAGRNILRGPGLANLDLSATKEVALPRLGETGRIEFRAEVFNILNRVNFGMPNRTVFTGAVGNAAEAPLATAGNIIDTSTRSRQLQLALKLYF
ncbi:MAG: TonB-dependent receptor [Acidobacteria bacterium]|nr:TonB-dependent receptor [Acidobacteriota bacterium]